MSIERGLTFGSIATIVAKATGKGWKKSFLVGGAVGAIVGVVGEAMARQQNSPLGNTPSDVTNATNNPTGGAAGGWGKYLEMAMEEARRIAAMRREQKEFQESQNEPTGVLRPPETWGDPALFIDVPYDTYAYTGF